MSEWLTDKEKRILFSALSREKKVCVEVDKQCEPREAYETSLKSICESLEYKFMYDHLFKDMEKQIKTELLDKVAEKFISWDSKVKGTREDGICFFTIENILKGIEEMKAEVEE